MVIGYGKGNKSYLSISLCNELVLTGARVWYVEVFVIVFHVFAIAAILLDRQANVHLY